METYTDYEESSAVRVHGFRQGVGFQPSSVDVDSSMEMMLEFDTKDDQPEDLRDEDLDAEETWPSRRGSR